MNLYVVRNREGKFFRAMGFGGSGTNWVDSLEKAKFYPKMGQAKSRVTYFTKEWPDYGTPDILEFTLDVTQAKVIDMAETTKKSIARIERRKLQREANYRRYQIETLQNEQARIKEKLGRLDKLKAKPYERT